VTKWRFSGEPEEYTVLGHLRRFFEVNGVRLRGGDGRVFTVHVQRSDLRSFTVAREKLYALRKLMFLNSPESI
jgi:hypothetical protein